jgi:hypothetical protein
MLYPIKFVQGILPLILSLLHHEGQAKLCGGRDEDFQRFR